MGTYQCRTSLLLLCRSLLPLCVDLATHQSVQTSNRATAATAQLRQRPVTPQEAYSWMEKLCPHFLEDGKANQELQALFEEASRLMHALNSQAAVTSSLLRTRKALQEISTASNAPGHNQGEP
jgi:hypothetical protein